MTLEERCREKMAEIVATYHDKASEIFRLAEEAKVEEIVKLSREVEILKAQGDMLRELMG